MAEAVDRHTYKCVRLWLGIYSERRRYPYFWMDYNRTAFYRNYGHHFPADAGNYFNWKKISNNRKQWMKKKFYLHRSFLRNGQQYVCIRK